MRVLTFLAVLTSSSRVAAFGPMTSILAVNSQSRCASKMQPLKVGLAMDWSLDEDEAILMQRAMNCASNDSCSLDESRLCLDNVIHVQSGCASGTVNGGACEDIASAAELVANLRSKVAQKTQESRLVAAGLNIVAISATVLLFSAFSSGMFATHLDSTPFTPQEWWWALRDGYLPTMLSHYFRHGGLATASAFDSEVAPFNLQEWWWAFKGGYVNNMVEHYIRNGGLAVSDNYVSEVASLTPREWIYAIQGGYIDQLLVHNFHNGGLSVADSTEIIDAISMTPEEIAWAARGGYLQDAAAHFIRNGGL